MFVSLENLVYQNNPFITIGQSSIQHTKLNQLNITKQIFLNIYHFSSTLVLLKYQIHLLNTLFLNPAYLAALLFELRVSAPLSIQWIANFNTIHYALELQVCSYCLNIGQHWLNVVLTI